MKVHLRMTGCRLNQAEIDQMARQLIQQGHQIVADPAEADQVIVNTCAVTQEATRSSRQLIRDLHRANAAAPIAVTGCYAQIAPQEIQTLDGVRQVVDNLGKDTLVEQLTGQPPEPFDHEPLSRQAQPGITGRTRAFIKVQDGCDNECTFCITTIARGAGRSRPLADILHEIQTLHQVGYQEAVLTGVHLGSYGHDLGQPDGLRRLVQAILAETDIPRVRLSSLEPWDLAPDFFDLWHDPRLCRHLHLPLQSGCDATLKRMRRNTTAAAFRQLMAAARQAIVGACITTDVIVGFPGETDDEFNQSQAFIHEMQFDGLHVFRYSPRAGTPAARMKRHVANAIKQQRSAALIAHAEAMQARFTQQFIGQTLPVLWEAIAGTTADGFINVGYTDNYIRVRHIHPRILTNWLTPARLRDYDPAQRLAQIELVDERLLI